MIKDKDLRNTISFLKAEVQLAQKLLKPSATGHIHTTINFLTNRIRILEEELAKQTYPFIGKQEND